MRRIKATVAVYLDLRYGETYNEAVDRLFERLYDGLCEPHHDVEFTIEEVEEE